MAKSWNSADARRAGSRFWQVFAIVAIPLVVGLIVNQPCRGAAKAAKSGTKSAAKAKAAAKAEEKDHPGDDDAFEADENLTALVVPSGVLAKAKAADKMKFSQELRGLLMEGMGSDRESQAAAKRHFEASHRLLEDDPRASYAYAITLLSQKKPKEALEQFRAAAQQSKAPFLPALQGTVWVHILKNDYARGIPAALDLAGKIEGTRQPWPTDRDRQHSAEWLGRIVGYLTGPGKRAEEAAAIEKLAEDIDKLLTNERKAAYEQGQKSVAERYQELKALTDRPVDEVLAEAKQKTQDLLAAAQAAEAEVKQLEDELREIKKPRDKQIADLNRELRAAAVKHKQAARDLAEADEAVDELSVPQQYPQVRMNGRTPTVALRAETAQEKTARETQLAADRQKQQHAQSTLDQSKQQMTDTKAQREQVETDYKHAMAEKRPALAAARRKAQDLTARAKDVEHGGLNPEKIKSRVTALETYAPLDPETEKSRLLATLKSPGAG